MRSEWNEAWIIRPGRLDDLDRAVEMFNARSQKLHGENQSTPDQMLGWWRSPRFEIERDTQIVLDEAGRMIGWAHVSDPGEPYVTIGCGVIAHPDAEDCPPLWERLHAWALDQAWAYVPRAPEGARVIAVGSAMAEDEARRAAFERAGYELVRVGNRMRIDLDEEPPKPTWPEGIGLRTADVERDLPAIVRADMEAFRDHWGHVERPFDRELEGWQDFVRSLGERVDPSLWFLAIEGEEIVGFSVCTGSIADDETRGYVDGLCVRPAWRRRGIALALLHHSFGELRRRGKEAVELDMDSENLTGALHLYERAGMHVIRQSLSYDRVLRDGEDLVKRA